MVNTLLLYSKTRDATEKKQNFADDMYGRNFFFLKKQVNVTFERYLYPTKTNMDSSKDPCFLEVLALGASPHLLSWIPN